MDHHGQTIRPQPRGIDRLKLLPTPSAVSPYLKAPWIPVIPKQVCRSFGSIELEPGTPIALDAMTSNQGRQPAIRMPQEHVGNVRTRRSDGVASNLPIRHNQSFGALDFS